METIDLTITEQQHELLDVLATDRGISLSALASEALVTFVAQEAYHLVARPRVGGPPASLGLNTGPVRHSSTLLPVSGEVIELAAGETLRVTQIDGEQCVDFNAFLLDDTDEELSVGHSRRSGFRLEVGDELLSNRMRPIMTISQKSPTCVTDLLGSRCNPQRLERQFNGERHTNCQDTLAACIEPYGLSADRVHDSFNIWMNSQWDSSGRWWSGWNTGRPGDVIELTALVDLLAVPAICGSGDLSIVSNFDLRPVRVEVLAASDETRTHSEKRTAAYESLASACTPNTARSARGSTPVSEPQFLRFPLKREQLTVEADVEVAEVLDRLVVASFARDREDAVRKALMTWYVRNITRTAPFAGDRFRW